MNRQNAIYCGLMVTFNLNMVFEKFKIKFLSYKHHPMHSSVFYKKIFGKIISAKRIQKCPLISFNQKGSF